MSLIAKADELQQIAAGLGAVIAAGRAAAPVLTHATEVLRDTQRAAADASEALRAANDRMAGLREAATGRPNRQAADLDAGVRALRDDLQYLRDTGATAQTIAKLEQEIAEKQTALDEAEKKARIADYEFRHSDAYKEQQAAIERAKAAEAAATKAAEDERLRQEAESKRAEEAARVEQERQAREATQKAAASLFTLHSAASSAAETSKAMGDASSDLSAGAKKINKQADDFAEVLAQLREIVSPEGRSMADVVDQLLLLLDYQKKLKKVATNTADAQQLWYTQDQIDALWKFIKDFGGMAGYQFKKQLGKNGGKPPSGSSGTAGSGNSPYTPTIPSGSRG